ncbi:MAG TPA: DUF669 domain-containing protein [Phycisphaerales bacterium]
MATLNNFDANQVDPSVALDPLPAGKYLAVVSESELKPTKTGGGKYLQLTFQIIDGEFKGRLVWARLNLENKSEMTVKIARGELSAICRAIGVMQPKDSVELHNVPLEINVGLKKRDDNGEFTNVIKGYAKKGGGGAPMSARAPVSAGPGSTPPWKR